MNAASNAQGKTVYAVCIKGGPITKCEEYLMEGIVGRIKHTEYNLDLKENPQKPKIVVAKLKWDTFKGLMDESKHVNSVDLHLYAQIKLQ